MTHLSSFPRPKLLVEMQPNPGHCQRLVEPRLSRLPLLIQPQVSQADSQSPQVAQHPRLPSGRSHTARTSCSNWLVTHAAFTRVIAVMRPRSQLVDQQLAISWSRTSPPPARPPAETSRRSLAPIVCACVLQLTRDRRGHHAPGQDLLAHDDSRPADTPSPHPRGSRHQHRNLTLELNRPLRHTRALAQSLPSSSHLLLEVSAPARTQLYPARARHSHPARSCRSIARPGS